jgi:hypothetical protein
MTPELQKYYEDRFSMMAMDGWKELIIDIDIMIESLNNGFGAGGGGAHGNATAANGRGGIIIFEAF